jgi:hypothetical protein
MTRKDYDDVMSVFTIGAHHGFFSQEFMDELGVGLRRIVDEDGVEKLSLPIYAVAEQLHESFAMKVSPE